MAPGASLNPLADTHCHLDFQAYDSDRDQVISRAWEKGVKWILNPGIDLQTSRDAIRLAEMFPGVYAAVGVHPNDGLSWDAGTLQELEKLAGHPRVLAIGEIGLDYYRDRTLPKVQMKIFRTQLELAARLHLPVIVHCRQAMEDLQKILKEWCFTIHSRVGEEKKPFGVLHSFDGDLDEARQAIEMSFLIGVGGPVTFQNARQKQELIKALPLENIVLETDAPFLTPHPYRGQRNEPGYIPLIAEAVATLQKRPFDTVARVTTQNAARLFSWSL
ncbi:MAG TPA: TatD family hydrolase [Anaerolineaceae bacterium]|nr:TatD family hydrolase [Anaerolineaceae bacterium]